MDFEGVRLSVAQAMLIDTVKLRSNSMAASGDTGNKQKADSQYFRFAEGNQTSEGALTSGTKGKETFRRRRFAHEFCSFHTASAGNNLLKTRFNSESNDRLSQENAVRYPAPSRFANN